MSASTSFFTLLKDVFALVSKKSGFSWVLAAAPVVESKGRHKNTQKKATQ
jgi:hypothetical protein